MTTQSDYTAAVIRALRQNFGWSQGDLADRSKLDRNVITNIEIRRRENITLDELTNLADAFGVSPAFLLGTPGRADRTRLGARVMEELAPVLGETR